MTGDNMNGDKTTPRDNRQTIIIVLAVVLTILVGLVIGFLASGGLSGDPAAAPTTTPAGPPATAGSTPTTAAAPTSPTISVAPGQLAVAASEDTFVNSGQAEEINGFEDALEIENDPPENKQALIRFVVGDIPEGETLQTVSMRLFVIADTEEVVTVHEVEGPWTQADATGANAPAVGAQIATVPPGTAEGSTVEVDLTSIVTGPGTYDFYLTMASDDSAEFAALESGANAPVLILDWGSAEAAATESEPVAQLAGTPVILAGAGDISDCGNEGDTVTAELIDGVVAQDPSAIVFTTGDNVYSSGTTEEFAQCYDPTWGRHKARTRPAPGNHDYNTTDASGYFGYFGEAAGQPSEGYYTYEAGDWQVLVLNSNCGDVACGAASPQLQWLQQQLESSDAACTLAYWHHPLFSSGDSGSDAGMRDLFAALYEGGADLVVNGHDHNYERFAPQDPDGIHDPVQGIRQFVAGTGGTGNRSFDQLAPNSEARYTDSFGILKLALYADGYEWEFIPEAGSSFVDVGIGTCH
ncbi:MAG TPA: DNRLRE domain-containing protein [Acidimicrobiia bacterium]|nr:DNRLRE domain-containing protein [Acidimicrobiia bacterium]